MQRERARGANVFIIKGLMGAIKGDFVTRHATGVNKVLMTVLGTFV